MAGSFVYTIDGKVKFWETVRCFYEDHSASTQPPRRLPRAGGRLLTSCSLLPAASPGRGDGGVAGTAVLQRRMLSDDSLHYVYSYAGNGGGTILRGGRVLYKASSSDSIQLLKDTLTGETDHYLVAHSTPGTEERTSTLYDADGNAVMTFPYAVNATLSGGLLILRDDADVWAFENGTTGGTRVYDLATAPSFPYPKQRSAASWWTRAASASSSTATTCPRGLLTPTTTPTSRFTSTSSSPTGRAMC